MLKQNFSKKYLPICGTKTFHKELKKLIFRKELENTAACYTLGGTGGLRIAAELIRTMSDQRTVWCSNPTWGNHISIMEEARVNYQLYPYKHTKCILDIDTILEALTFAKKGDFVLLHACCHNPTGVDPTQSQWNQIFDFMENKGLIPFFDIAYHGFNEGRDEDIWSIRQASTIFSNIVVVYSFSKVLGMYGERSGGILVKTESATQQKSVQSNFV